MIIDKIRKTIERYNLLDYKDSVVVGLSGGPDSVCLLHILNELKREYDLKIYAAHLNHKIRGIEAQKDAIYCAKLCDDMNIHCFIRAIDVPKYCKENGYSIEEGARILRYNMFFEIKQKVGANKIAVAHNLNDQIETILMRVIRGTGLDGLKGIQHKRDDVIIRPLLDIKRDEIEKYCSENNLNPRIDQSNLEDVYTRNKIRLRLIPYIEENFNPNLNESISRMVTLLKDDSDFLDKESEKVFNDICKKEDSQTIKINVNTFNGVHKAIKNRIIRKCINFVIGNIKGIEQKHIEDVLELIQNQKTDLKINLPKGLIVYKKDEEIIFTDKEIKHEQINYSYKVPKSGFIKIKELNMIVETKMLDKHEVELNKEDKYTKYFDFDKISGQLEIRNRKDGDKIKLLGLGGSKKLKDLFIDLKIPKDERGKIPILCDEKGIIWLVGYRMSEDYKIDKTTKKVLRVSIENV
ncbi:tRNA(Ile)-lysidine synthase [Alkalithermobacter thermoalcaliphilus JW-YL-7 = DSM 7308]|uniref:tRNA(Ile)-lysidine synthase n=1 Tax=Alkalithermobacter thermoalcaliphilus JW-YL-7 = DSM 7308 TaxID=1121328 RepID=A0A150FMP9_CLOPD|nr:tRNA(Ile)-lysidine synthase [[Clostridium] paradoxum JW-YL-7 = DSM 7308]SHL30845.1 tRNA(Ile)-lysidine synthase [[Clostridium] paradoxum JW-YL-7 = DSM 7308]